MTGLDTNVLVRYLAQDDIKQSARATRLIDQELTAAQPGFVSLMVLVELCGVLKQLYAATPQELRELLADLLGMPQIQLERRDVVQAALKRLQDTASAKAGIADALIHEVAASHGCTHTLSFDKAVVKAAGMTMLQ